ncbi:hypothetical protein C8T65DRAFT_697332 [Cerioporus squamosus]|nr:hypothetical protein C8T65DRAFT_697332 [Cerioporus squamosus]
MPKMTEKDLCNLVRLPLRKLQLTGSMFFVPDVLSVITPLARTLVELSRIPSHSLRSARSGSFPGVGKRLGLLLDDTSFVGPLTATFPGVTHLKLLESMVFSLEVARALWEPNKQQWQEVPARVWRSLKAIWATNIWELYAFGLARHAAHLSVPFDFNTLTTHMLMLLELSWQHSKQPSCRSVDDRTPAALLLNALETYLPKRSDPADWSRGARAPEVAGRLRKWSVTGNILVLGDGACSAARFVIQMAQIGYGAMGIAAGVLQTHWSLIVAQCNTPTIRVGPKNSTGNLACTVVGHPVVAHHFQGKMLSQTSPTWGECRSMVSGTPAYQQAVVLFRDPKEEAFAVVIGVTPSGLAWAEALVKGAGNSKEGDWAGSAHDTAKRIWEKYSDVGGAEDLGINKWNADKRKARKRRFGDKKTRIVMVTFRPWELGAEGHGRVTYMVGIELAGTAYPAE